MGQDDGSPPKKDLTGIMDLPQADPVKDPDSPDGSNPFEFNELKPVEQIDDFASLDQIGMMDHPVVEEAVEETAEEEMAQTVEASAEETVDPTVDPTVDRPLESAGNDPVIEAGPANSDPLPGADPFLLDSAPPIPGTEEPINPDFSADPFSDGFSLEDRSPPSDELEPLPAKPVLDDLKTYSEAKKETPFEPGRRTEFHLLMTGEFNPYARDKLLLFLTENSIAIPSTELDFQIKSNRVLLPRISEFSGVKLIQDLRDSGLSFVLKPSDRETELPADDGKSKSFRFEEGGRNSSTDLPVLPAGEFKAEEYRVLDSIQMVQYLQAEILEVEQSELFQDLLDRMTEALKQRAKLKGANALTHLNHRITPLRLPSQYQIELSASLLKRI